MCNKCGLNLCTCKNWSGEFHMAMLDHLAENFQQSGWKLTYQTLEGPGRTLCKIGVCRRCGHQLCVGTHIPDGGNLDLFLTLVYRLFYEKWLRLHEPMLPGMTIPGMFTALFHEEDRPQVTQWLSQPEYTHALLIWGVEL